MLEEQTPNKKMATVIGQIRADVEAGISLSDALEKHPKAFSRLYVSMVRAGAVNLFQIFAIPLGDFLSLIDKNINSLQLR